LEQVELLRYAIEVLERLGIVYMVVGSYASGSYGEPRFTQDIDIVVDLQLDQIDVLCSSFPAPEYYVSKDGVRSALQHRSQFDIIHSDSGMKLDLIIPKGDQYSREQVARRQRVQLIPGQEAFTARPEDIIIGKMVFYEEGGSEKHLRDITGMMRVSGAQIDRDYIGRWAASLNLMEIWKAILGRLR
jgi:hypothetical protein